MVRTLARIWDKVQNKNIEYEIIARKIITTYTRFYLVVNEEKFEKNPWMIALCWVPQLFVFERIPPFLIVPDFEEWNFDFAKKLVLVVLVFVVHSHFQHVVNIFHIAKKVGAGNS